MSLRAVYDCGCIDLEEIAFDQSQVEATQAPALPSPVISKMP
jgi:hypothetical protein